MKALSLNQNHLFKRTYKKGISVISPYAVMYCIKNNQEFNRLGITVSKKVGKAVVRNRARRLLKESYRLLEDNVRPGFDIVIVARTRTAEASLEKVMAALIFCLKKSGMYIASESSAENKG